MHEGAMCQGPTMVNICSPSPSLNATLRGINAKVLSYLLQPENKHYICVTYGERRTTRVSRNHMGKLLDGRLRSEDEFYDYDDVRLIFNYSRLHWMLVIWTCSHRPVCLYSMQW